MPIDESTDPINIRKCDDACLASAMEVLKERFNHCLILVSRDEKSEDEFNDNFSDTNCQASAGNSNAVYGMAAQFARKEHTYHKEFYKKRIRDKDA